MSVGNPFAEAAAIWTSELILRERNTCKFTIPTFILFSKQMLPVITCMLSDKVINYYDLGLTSGLRLDFDKSTDLC